MTCVYALLAGDGPFAPICAEIARLKAEQDKAGHRAGRALLSFAPCKAAVIPLQIQCSWIDLTAAAPHPSRSSVKRETTSASGEEPGCRL
jgi:hypothetical protein